MSVTLKEIAKYSGVSVATVSLSLNNKPVNSDTKKRVVKVAKRLGYSPSELVRGLRTKKTYTLGLAIGIPNLELRDTVVHTAQKRDY